MDELNPQKRKRLEIQKRRKELEFGIVEGGKSAGSMPKQNEQRPPDDPDAKLDYKKMLEGFKRPQNNDKGARSDTF